jgi:isopentenyl-diphosphate Delta-isomerase
MTDDQVVLVDSNNKVLGTKPKFKAHNSKTPLHRGFSVFLFNSRGEVLLQQRSRKKKTFPLVWSNSFCGHPMLNEANVDAAKRRMPFEIGINNVEITEVISNYRYKAEMNGIWENEICPILIGFTNKKPIINKNEVENFKWVNWKNFIEDAENNPKKYSLWCTEETKLLKNHKTFLKLYNSYII